MSKPVTEGAPAVSVVVPVYRNAATLPELKRRLAEALDRSGVSHELVLVVDGCREGSFEAAAGLAGGDARVRAVRLKRNYGQNQAVMAGIRLARGLTVAVMDADLQDPPEAVPRLLEAAGRGYAAVFAGRRGRYESSGRLMTSRLFKWALHKMTGLPRDAGMFVLFDRRVRRRLLDLHAPKPFVVAMIGCCRLPVTSIPVSRDVRPGGGSAYSSWKRAATALCALWWAAHWRRQLLYGNGQQDDATDRGG